MNPVKEKPATVAWSQRIPRQLFHKIAEMADREMRTTANMIVVLLHEAIQKRGKR